MFLQPGEAESWRGKVDGSAVKPGKYQIVRGLGAYIPAYDQIHELVGLPEAHGLLVTDALMSIPVFVRTGAYRIRLETGLLISSVTR